jgi:hypothetical protein
MLLSIGSSEIWEPQECSAVSKRHCLCRQKAWICLTLCLEFERKELLSDTMPGFWQEPMLLCRLSLCHGINECGTCLTVECRHAQALPAG